MSKNLQPNIAQKQQAESSWDTLFGQAAGLISKFLSNPVGDDIDMSQIKVATSVLSSYTRHEATASARDQTAVIIARELAGNKEEFAKYLEISMPKVKMLKP